MNCEKCGSPLLPTDTVCSNCGTPVRTSSPGQPATGANRFRQVEAEYFRLRGQLASGRLTQEQFEAALQPLMFQDEQGRYWMIGVESGKWHVFDGKTWAAKDPPVAVLSTAPLPQISPPIHPSDPGMPLAKPNRARLNVLRGAANMAMIEFGREGATLGRATSNSLVVNDAQVSRLHARIDYDGATWTARDLNSRNGTYVNGRRITAQALQNGDQITVGITVLTFQT
ncbi:MAG: FHA domain-containing protein [Chloroflexi bacterium]|nr:FHA domain-containing protein [Chloroflexota bacterium]